MSSAELDELSAALLKDPDEARALSVQARQPGDAASTVERQLALHRWLFAHGWLTPGWPAEVGGTGESPLMRAAVYETLTRLDVQPPTTINSIEVLGPMLLKFAPDVSQTYVPELISGSSAWCQGFSEPESGSDLASIRLRATKTDAGWRLNGQKIWSTRAYGSSRCLVLARTGTQEERHRGMSMLLVDMDTPGLECRPIADMAGGEHFGEIFFDDVEVGDDRLIGEPNRAWTYAMYLFAWERGMYAWMRQSALHRTLAELAPLTTNDPIAQAQLGSALAETAALRMRSLSTIRTLEEAGDVGPLVSVDKLLLSRAERAVQDLANRVRPIALIGADQPDRDLWTFEFLHSRSAPIYGGSAEIQKTVVATRLLELPRAAQ